MKYHNVRNNIGQFSKKSLARKKAIFTIRNGSLYDWKGNTVRVLSTLNNGMKLVGIHKSLFGFAKEKELRKIDSDKVKAYLD